VALGTGNLDFGCLIFYLGKRHFDFLSAISYILSPARRLGTYAVVVATLGLVAPGAYAQLIIERTVNVGVVIPDRGQYVSTILWDHGGLTSISRVSVDLTLSSPSVTNPMWLGDMFASLTHGTASETERAATVFDYFGGDPDNSATSLVGSYHFETQFDGSWLASNRWSLLLADRAQGGVGRLDSWKLTVEGVGASSGIFRPGSSGRLAVSHGQSSAAVGAAVDLESGSTVAAEAAANKILRLEGGLTGAGDLETSTAAGGKVVVAGNSENFTGVVKVGGNGTTQLDSVTALGRGTLRQTNGDSVVRLNFAGSFTNAIDIYKVAFATNGATLAGTTTVNNAEFDVASGDTNTITGQITGSGGVTKTGGGRLVLAGTATNDFTGASAVNAGTLWLNKAAGTTAISGSTIAVNSGGTLLLGAANQISDSTQVTMAGGTVALGGYNETAGRLAVTADSIFDFGTAAGGTNTFTFTDFDTSGYGGVAGLTFSNVGAGSKVVFNTDYMGNTTFNTFTSKISFNDVMLEGQISFSGGTTTLTVAAIPDARVAWAAGVLCALVGTVEWRRRREKKIGVSS
jgi:autotransporter-associated beta strand protein